MESSNKLNTQLQNLELGYADLTQWENVPGSSDKDLDILTQIATSILNLQNLPVEALSHDQRLHVRNTLTRLHTQLTSRGPMTQRVQNAYQAANPNLQQGLKNLVGNAEALLRKMGAFEQTALDPITPEIMRSPETAKSLLVQGAPISDPSLLWVACESNDYELIDMLLNRYKADCNYQQFYAAFTFVTDENDEEVGVLAAAIRTVHSLPAPEGVRILNRLIQAHKDSCMLTCSDPNIQVGLCDLVRRSRLYGAVLLDVMEILDPQAMMIPAVYQDIEKLVTIVAKQFFKPFMGAIEQREFTKAFFIAAKLHQWSELQENPHERLEQILDAMQERILPLLRTPEQCGPFLDSLKEQMPMLFDVCPDARDLLEVDGSLVIAWLQANNWWRDRDPSWFSIEMSQADDQGLTHLHRALMRGHEVIRLLPADVLRAGINRYDNLGATPLIALVSLCLSGDIERRKGVQLFDEILGKLGEPALGHALNSKSASGQTLMHILFAEKRPQNAKGSVKFVHCFAQYPKYFQEMLLTRDREGWVPLQHALNDFTPGHRPGNRTAVRAILQFFDLPVNADDVMQPSERFVPWLRERMSDHPPPVRLLLLPLLRGDPQEIPKALKGCSAAVAQWLTDAATIRALLLLPNAAWQGVLQVRDDEGVTPLEHLARCGDTLFWQMLDEHDEELPLEVLSHPKYGFPLHVAAESGQLPFLESLLGRYVTVPVIQQELLVLRDLKRRTIFKCARLAGQEPVMLYLLRDVAIPSSRRENEQIANVLGKTPISLGEITTSSEGRTALDALQRNTLALKREYFNKLPQLKNMAREGMLPLILPSLAMIQNGIVVTNYFGDAAIETTIKEAPADVNFAEVLIPFVEQLPIEDDAIFEDYEGVLEGEQEIVEHEFGDIKHKLVLLIRSLDTGDEIYDPNNKPLPDALKTQMKNVLSHVARYIQDARAEIAVAESPQDAELLARLNKEMENELIGDFGVGLFHCIDGNAGHMLHLYDYVMGTRIGSLSLADQVQAVLQKYLNIQFELIVGQVASGNTHEATTLAYYRARLAKAFGLGNDFSGMGNAYAAYAVQDREQDIIRAFSAENTPIKFVDYICGLLNDKKDKTLNKALVLDWFRQNFSVHEDEIMDEDVWRPEAVGLFLTALGVIKPKVI